MHCRFAGVVTCADHGAAFEQISAHERFSALKFIIADYRDIKGVAYASDMLDYSVVLLLGAYNTNPRIKLCVISNHKIIRDKYAMHIMEMQFLHEVKLINDISDAYAWLRYVPRAGEARGLASY